MTAFKPGEVVVVTKGSAPGPHPFLAIVETNTGRRCMITYKAPDGSERMRGEFSTNLRIASAEERRTLSGMGRTPRQSNPVAGRASTTA